MGSKTTTTNKTAPLDATGREYESMVQGLYQQQLADAGYTTTPTQKTEFQDPTQAQNLQAQISKYNDRLSKLDAQIAKRDADLAAAGITRGSLNGQGRRNGPDSLDQERIQIQNSLDAVQNKYDKLPQVTYTNWDIQKKPDVRVQDAIDRFGPDSEEVKNMQAQVKQEEVDNAVSSAEVNKAYMASLSRMFDVAGQDQQRSESFQTIKDLVTSQSQKLMLQVGDNADALSAKLNDISSEIDKTGFDVADALHAASIQIDKTGEDLYSTLAKVNESTYNRAQFQFGLLSEQIDKKTAQQAALLGLPPGSQFENFQKAKLKTDTMNGLILDLNEREAQGAMGVAQYIGQEKQKIALSGVALAESQGGKKEALAGQRFALSDMEFNKQEGIQGSTANTLMGITNSNEAQKFNIRFGQAGTQIAAGQNAATFDFQQQANQQNLDLAVQGPATHQLDIAEQRQLANNTQVTKKSPGFLDTFTGIVGVGAAGAGSVMSGMGGV